MTKRPIRSPLLDFIAKTSIVVHTLRDQYALSRLEAEWWCFQNLSTIQATAEPKDAAAQLFSLWDHRGENEFHRTVKEHFK